MFIHNYELYYLYVIYNFLKRLKFNNMPDDISKLNDMGQ